MVDVRVDMERGGSGSPSNIRLGTRDSGSYFRPGADCVEK
jgi:hypothetical protein